MGDLRAVRQPRLTADSGRPERDGAADFAERRPCAWTRQPGGCTPYTAARRTSVDTDAAPDSPSLTARR